MKYNVTDIEFETDLGTGIKEEYAISFEEEIALRDSALGVWEADNEDDLLEDWEDLFDVHTILGETKQEYEKKLEIAQAKQPKAEW